MLTPWTQAARSLFRRPGFAVSAVLILGAGIAATTSVFSVVDAAVLQPLPYPQSDRLVYVLEANSAKSEAASLIAPGRLEDWNRLNHTFTALSGDYVENVTETSGDTPERLAGLRVTPRFFAVFGVAAAVGRTFTAEDEANGGPAAVVISDHLWTRRFHRRSDVTSQHLELKNQSFAIVGVMPPNFGERDVDVWLPARLTPQMLQQRDARFLSGVGRLMAGVSIAQARRDLAGVQAALGAEFPATDKGWSAEVTDLKTARLGDARQPLVFILASVGLLLLLALANTAGLVLTQLQRRETELAIRGFLGASRVQIVAGVVREVLMLAALAIAVAVAVDVAVLRVSTAVLSALPRVTHLSVDWRALVVASLCGVAAAVACGAWPAWRATRAGAAAGIARAGRGQSSDSRSQRALVGAQIAIATLLLCSTSLLLRSYYNIVHVDPGFDAAHAITFHVGAAWEENRDSVRRMQLGFVSALAAMPGVTAVGFSNFLPASNATLRYRVHLLDVASGARVPDRDQLTVGERSVTGGYFAALGARVVAGAACPPLAHVRDGGPQVLVNRRFVDAYARGGNVVGRFLRWSEDRPGSPNTQIVGVVDDIREDNLRTGAVPYVYACLGPGEWPDPEYVVRTSGSPRAILSSVRAVVHGVDPTRAVFGLTTLEDNVDATLGQTRLQTGIISAFGAAAVALAMIGLYGLVALAVTTRRREIGIRIALGAEPARVVRELAARVGWLLAAGAGAGIVMTVLAQRELRALVVGVAPLDPLTLGAAVLALGMAAGVAALVPASRAARIDPVDAIRESE
ncbi:MAG TPA: ADOP family duplicated permease [Gemmatimonadaceae bacterium]|nr:ADOP family duplicated permease [Gemmatimonadaceae bacterium]